MYQMRSQLIQLFFQLNRLWRWLQKVGLLFILTFNVTVQVSQNIGRI